jgi:hypothetical protein
MWAAGLVTLFSAVGWADVVGCGGQTHAVAGGLDGDVGRDATASHGSSGSGTGIGSGTGTGSGSNETLCDGVGVDEQTDPANCGGCGVTCAGTCALGRCLVTLASGRANPSAITVDATNVYWTDDPPDNTVGGSGSVMQVPTGGGAPATIASGQKGPQAIAVEGSSVYWTNFDSYTVLEAPVGGGTPTTLVSDADYVPLSLVANATNIAWTTQGTTGSGAGTVMTVALGGGSAATLASDQQDILGLTMDATNVYWKSGASILKAALAGGTTTTLCTLSASTSGASWGMAVDATSVYWTGRDGSAGALMKVPVTGGTPATLASGPSMWTVLTIDATAVYFTGAGAVLKMPLGGGTPTTLAAGHSGYGIAVDATSVYWTEWTSTGTDGAATGAVMKLSPK